MEDNDNEAPGRHTLWSGLDAHGQAALLLTESVLHGLIARSVISVADAIEMVDVAADVKAEISVELADKPESLRKSLQLLAAIRSSLILDLPD